MSYTTLRAIDRDASRELARRVDLLLAELRSFAGAGHGEARGRYVVFGSAATGDLSRESDVDILADFDAADEAEALEFAEATASRLGLRLDLFPKRLCTKTFLGEIERRPTIEIEVTGSA